MPNEKNLMPIEEVNSRRTREEHSNDSRRAGVASGEARRKRKSMKENMNLLLDLDVAGPADFNKLTAIGVPTEEINNAMLLTVALFRKAMTGDVAAFKEIMGLIGEGAGNEDGELMDLIRGLKDD